jgi:hypothetical protein
VIALSFSVQPCFTSNFSASFTSFTIPLVALTVSVASSRVFFGVIKPTPLVRVIENKEGGEVSTSFYDDPL